MKHILEVNNLTKEYKGNIVISNLSCKFGEGEVIGLLGHNGAGKSTLIKCIMQLTHYKGEINYNFDAKELYQNVNVQLQQEFYEDMSKVREVCSLYKKIQKSNVDVDNLLQEFDLLESENKYINQLSGGQKQKLSVLLTLIGEPKMIIFDEITTGLDVVGKRKIWNLIRQIRQERNITIILTSHFLEEVEYLADRVIVLEQGIKTLEGTVEGLIKEQFGDKKKIEYTIHDETTLKQSGFSYVQNADDKNRYGITYSEKEEKDILDKLGQIGAFDFEMKKFTLEDVFLNCLGYKINEKGEIINV